MTDITAAPATSGIKIPGLGEIGTFLKRGDYALAVGVLTILVVLILPLPPVLLDLSLAISIILSVLILMTITGLKKMIAEEVKKQDIKK